MTASYFSDGYLKYYNRRGRKVFKAVVRSPLRGARVSRKRFQTAWTAADYGERLVERYARLKACARQKEAA